MRRIVGQKRPRPPRHVWAIRVRLEIENNGRDLALFNTAIDSKLRGCDLVRLKVADVYAARTVKERASVLQSKTEKPVKFELSDGTGKSLNLGWKMNWWLAQNICDQVVSTIACIYQRANTLGSYTVGLNRLDWNQAHMARIQFEEPQLCKYTERQIT